MSLIDKSKKHEEALLFHESEASLFDITKSDKEISFKQFEHNSGRKGRHFLLVSLTKSNLSCVMFVIPCASICRLSLRVFIKI